MANTVPLLFPAGGIAAGSPFTLNQALFVSAITPPAASSGGIVRLAGFIGVPATAAGDATNLDRAIGIGLDLQNYTALITGTTRRPVFIGFQSGYSDALGVPADAVAIGNGCRTEANGVAIGAGVVVRCNAGSDRPVVINSTGVTNVNVIGIVAIGNGGSSILSQQGCFIVASNTVNTGGGIGIGGTTGPDVQAYGIAIGLESTVLLTGNRGIVIGGSAARAGAPTTATDYARCIAIGIDAVATGGGAGGSVHAIAIGDAASATGSTTAAAIALGRSAVATAGQCVIGSAARPYNVVLAGVATLGVGAASPGPTIYVEAAGGPTIRLVRIGFAPRFDMINDGTDFEIRAQDSGNLNFYAGAGVAAARFDPSAVADDTRLLVFDVTAAVLKRVSRGAVDSGGVGFRLLRIPN